MGAKERKQHFVKTIEADFVKKIRPVLSPMKAAIRRELGKGKTAHQAVDHVFREHNLRWHLKKLVVDSMVKAAYGG